MSDNKTAIIDLTGCKYIMEIHLTYYLKSRLHLSTQTAFL